MSAFDRSVPGTGERLAVAVGPRLYARPPRATDADAFVAAMRRSRDLHRGWAAPPTSPEAFAAYLAREGRDDVAGYLFLRRDDDALVGYANLSHIFHGALCGAVLGYNGVAGHTGRGYMTEGLGLVLRDAFGRHGLHRVEANVQPTNAASLAVVRRLGFRKEGYSPRYLRIAGEWRDHERWALLADEPAAAPYVG